MLKHQIQKARSEESGFTLIELLIVIVIMGILSAVVVFAVGGITDRGDSAACKSDVKTVEVAVEAYYAKNKAYPATIAALATPGSNQFLKTVPTRAFTYDAATGSVAANPVCP